MLINIRSGNQPFGRKTYIDRISAKARKRETQKQREKRLFHMKGHNLKKREFETKEEAIACPSVNSMCLSVKIKYKSEEDDNVKSQAKRRATESDLSCSTRLAKDAARHEASRKIASKQQIATRRALDVPMHKAMRCNESDQQITSQSDAVISY